MKSDCFSGEELHCVTLAGVEIPCLEFVQGMLVVVGIPEIGSEVLVESGAENVKRCRMYDVRPGFSEKQDIPAEVEEFEHRH